MEAELIADVSTGQGADVPHTKAVLVGLLDTHD